MGTANRQANVAVIGDQKRGPLAAFFAVLDRGQGTVDNLPTFRCSGGSAILGRPTL